MHAFADQVSNPIRTLVGYPAFQSALCEKNIQHEAVNVTDDTAALQRQVIVMAQAANEQLLIGRAHVKSRSSRPDCYAMIALTYTHKGCFCTTKAGEACETFFTWPKTRQPSIC